MTQSIKADHCRVSCARHLKAENQLERNNRLHTHELVAIMFPFVCDLKQMVVEKAAFLIGILCSAKVRGFLNFNSNF